MDEDTPMNMRYQYLPAVIILLSAICLCGASSPANAGIEVTDLRCEYLEDPRGIDVVRPRLNWRISEKGKPGRGLKQIAYRVLVASSPVLLAKDKGDLWDSEVKSEQSIHIVYGGKALASRARCFWKVKVSCNKGAVSAWSKPARWSMGLLKTGDWQGAKWIGIEKQDIAAKKTKGNRTRLPARYLRREFGVTKEVKRATAYVCGLGFFDLHINGRKVGDHIRDPALSGYTKRAFYVTFDVGEYLAKGKNCIGAILGNGRYFAPRKVSPGGVKSMGFPKLLMHMRVEYQDGSTQDLVSGRDWKVTDGGPIRSNNEFDGEEYDARMEIPKWDLPAFDDSKWKKVELVKPPGGVLEAQMMDPMRIIEVRKPVKITRPKDGMYIVDMGQAYYGSVRLKVSGPAGTRVQMRSAYNVNPDGTLRSRDNRTALSSDVYILKGGGKEVWHPRFRGQGYRYVEVTGFPGEPKADNFDGLVIHTDFDTVGEFACSNPLINRIYSNIRWTQRAYIRSLSMEPDRDERQGWLGTQAKDFESNAFNFHMAGLLTKWLGDIRLDQLADGHIPDVSPTYWKLYHKGIVWPSNIVILPELQHDFYGDRRALKDNYAAMKKWMKFISRHLKPDSTVDHNRYGDWVDAYSMDKKGREMGHTPRALISTAYFYNNARIMVRVARLLGKSDDQKSFTDLAAGIKQGFNKRFFDPKTNQYGNGTQTSYVLPLAFGMVAPDRRRAVAAKLADDIMVTRKKHLSVGMVGMLYLMQTLTDTGYPEVAYAIAAQKTRPSWGYMVSKGTTTIWERWDTDTKGPGMNSEALLVLAGNLEAWFYQTLAGINHDPQHPGFKHIVLRPCPVGDLTYARASHKSMYGTIVSGWKRKGETFTWNITVPPNTAATVHVPAKAATDVTESGRPAGKSGGVTFLRMVKGRAVFSVGSGSYEFGSRLRQ
jgi:alpha-L-rhamnosidase